jgi:hydroxylamine dehydrogenase
VSEGTHGADRPPARPATAWAGRTRTAPSAREARPGTLTPKDFPAPTSATCHFSGFGGASTTHDVGERLTWFLAAPVSTRRPNWQDNEVRVQSVCAECHNRAFVDSLYAAADRGVAVVNARVLAADSILQRLKDRGLVTPAPFDESIDFVAFENWHHWGRAAKFGMWMRGPDYTQWHGAYEMLKSLAELRDMPGKKLEDAGGTGGGGHPRRGTSRPEAAGTGGSGQPGALDTQGRGLR